MDILVKQIAEKIFTFKRNDFNHRRPDSIMISRNLFYELRKTMQFANENPMFLGVEKILGLEILVVSNKDDLIKVFIMDECYD